jgi:LysM repeat protein
VVLILVPALISLLVTLLVLTIWERQQASGPRVITLPTHSPTAQREPVATFPPVEGVGEAQLTNEEPGGEEESAPNPEAVQGTPCDNPTHVVAAGEVAGSISELYGVPLEDLIIMNQLVDPEFNADVLSVGQVLTIPVCGIPPATVSPPTRTPTNTAVPARDTAPPPIPTATNPPPGTVSVEILSVNNPGDITREGVEIINRGALIDLANWTLTDGDDHEFEFPSYRLFPSGAVRVYTRVGENSAFELYWSLTKRCGG